jgi:hypothetical protein
MNVKMCALAAPALLLAACERTPAPPEPSAPAQNAAIPSKTVSATPAPTPPSLTAEADRGVTGARGVLLDFARAVELTKFDQAWTLLSPSDRQKWSKAQFAALFANLGEITVAVPTGSMEGAAGSSYYTAPVTITANDKDGRPVRMEGEAVLRRVNDVEGATPAQLRWHFDKLTLDWTH